MVDEKIQRMCEDILENCMGIDSINVELISYNYLENIYVPYMICREGVTICDRKFCNGCENFIPGKDSEKINKIKL